MYRFNFALTNSFFFSATHLKSYHNTLFVANFYISWVNKTSDKIEDKPHDYKANVKRHNKPSTVVQ